MKRVCGRFISDFQSHNFVNEFQRLQLYSSASASSSVSFANYLVHSLGFSHQRALSTSTSLSKHRKGYDLNFDSNANSVVGFLKNHGFDDTQIRKIVSSYPRVLCSDAENTLSPKLQFFQDQGFSGSDIVRSIVGNPKLLGMRMESSVLPSIQILRQVLVCDTHVIALFKKIYFSNYRGIVKYLLPNVALLSNYGMPIELIRKHILMHPDIVLQNVERLKDKLIRVENSLGITRDSPIFLYGIQLLSRFTEETIECKCQIFKSFRWTQFDIETLMMKSPTCFMLSAANIKKKLDFLMNNLRLEPAYLTSKASFFSCSLEKRILPRHKVLQILKEKCLLKKNPSLYSAICMSESRFLDVFVLPFNEVHEAYAMLTGFSMKMLTQEIANS